MLPNIEATDDVHINVGLHESMGPKEAEDLAAALAKVEAAYGKRGS